MPNELTNPNNVVTEERLAQFYQQILPYLGGASHLCIGGGYAPIGTILPFMGTIAPGGFLACDGSVYNIADYPALADFIDTQFGSIDFFGGDGLVTFAVPDLRGEFLRGTGTNSHTNQGSGENVGVHQDGTIIPGVRSAQNIIQMNYRGDGVGGTVSNYDEGYTATHYCNIGGSTGYDSTRIAAYTARPTNTSVLYCIKAELDNTYSTTEKIVGTWIDGKPIYQKTVSCGTVTADGSWHEVQHSISGIDQVVRADGALFGNNGNVVPVCSVVSSFNFTAYAEADRTKINYVVGSSRSSGNYKLYVTLQYTKTSS